MQRGRLHLFLIVFIVAEIVGYVVGLRASADRGRPVTAEDLPPPIATGIARCAPCAPVVEIFLPTPTPSVAVASLAPPPPSVAVVSPTLPPPPTTELLPTSLPSPTLFPSPTAEAPTPPPMPTAVSREARCKARYAGPPDGTFELITREHDGLVLCLWVPTTWTQREFKAWQDGESVIGLEMNAATDLAAMRATHDVPGIFYGASAQLMEDHSIADVLDRQKAGQMDDHCTFVERSDYDDNVYTGALDLYEGCNGGEIGAYVIAAMSEEPEVMLLLILFVPSGEAGETIYKEIQKGFFVLGPP